jgi:hypothetical protein
MQVVIKTGFTLCQVNWFEVLILNHEKEPKYSKSMFLDLWITDFRIFSEDPVIVQIIRFP